MLTEIYIEALLVNEELADQVWDAWFVNMIDDQTGAITWCLLALGAPYPSKHPHGIPPEIDRPITL